MSFDEEYIDPHGECATEIHRLKDVNAKLLAALKDAANFLAIATQDIIRGGGGKINASWATDITEAEKRARAAIAKAESSK